jgi:hypothetical protein
VSPTPEQFWNAWQTEPALRDLAERWLTKPDGEWADESAELYRLIDHDPERALKVIFCAVQLTTEPLILANLAAGPLEDFLGRHGERYLDVFHALALRERALREVLDGVWQGSMPKRVWHRIEILKQSAFS